MKRSIEHGISSELVHRRKEHSTTALGLVDSPFYPVGLSTAKAVSYTADHPKTGNKMHVTAVDLPVSGLGLEYLLRSIAPGENSFEVLHRETTNDDWLLPEQSSYPEDRMLHEAHMQLASYARFNKDHRWDWRQLLKKSIGGEFFEALWETRYVDPQPFLTQQYTVMRQDLEAWKRDEYPSYVGTPARKLIEPLYKTDMWEDVLHIVHDSIVSGQETGRYAGDQAKQSLAAVIASQRSSRYRDVQYETIRDRYPNDFFEAYLDHISQAPIDLQMRALVHSEFVNIEASNEGFVFIDPNTGRRWADDKYKPVITGKNVGFALEDKTVSLSSRDASATLQLGEVQQNGVYAITSSDFEYSDAFRSTARYPLIAWEETEAGERRFLGQEEATALIPEVMRDKEYDVMLGGLVLAHGQPAVSAQFMKEMGLPHKHTIGGTRLRHREGPSRASIKAAQMPAFVHLSLYERKLLAVLPAEL